MIIQSGEWRRTTKLSAEVHNAAPQAHKELLRKGFSTYWQWMYMYAFLPWRPPCPHPFLGWIQHLLRYMISHSLLTGISCPHTLHFPAIQCTSLILLSTVLPSTHMNRKAVTPISTSSYNYVCTQKMVSMGSPAATCNNRMGGEQQRWMCMHLWLQLESCGTVQALTYVSMVLST